MFCRYKGELPPLKTDVIYYISDFRSTALTGQLIVAIPGMWQKMYTNFEEFINEWEIV